MSAAEPEAVLSLTPALADLARLYPWLEAAGGAVPPGLLARLHVVAEEAVANVAMHAFPPGATGEILVRLLTGPQGVALIVEDAGAAFDPTQAPERARWANLMDAPAGGWGLGLIRRYCPDIAYERRDGRNRLMLRFPAVTP